MNANQYTSAASVTDLMLSMRNDSQRTVLMSFFKTGKGEYGEGDMFLGIKVPQTRAVGRLARDMEQSEIQKLLDSPWHEIRLCGFLILAGRMDRLGSRRLQNDLAAIEERERTVDFYIKNARRANNWDLVDVSAPKIVGAWLTLPSRRSEEEKLYVMDRLAVSSCLWEQRVAMVATITPTRNDDFRYVLRYSERLMEHPHDLMHKAVGWMLRELGKRDINILRAFLGNHSAALNRTTLRYAIERMDERERHFWLMADKKRNAKKAKATHD